MIAGYVLDRMGFVEDDGVIVGKNVDADSAQGKIAEKQSMIDDEDVGVLQSFSGFEVVALIVGRTFSAQTVATVALCFVPHAGQNFEVQIGS